MNFKKILFTMIFFAFSSVHAKVSVVTTSTDIKWLVQQIGGNKVTTESLLSGNEDPHFLDAMPHFATKVANADIFCLVGMELETAWAPKILERSGNKKVQPGGKGYCEVGLSVKALNIPKGRIDRSQGDIHSQGNPHYHLGPTYFLMGAQTVVNTLIGVDSKNAEYYLGQHEKLKLKMAKIRKEVQETLLPVKGKGLMEYHREFTYFLKEYGLLNLGAIEKVPGVPPSAGRIARVSIQAKNQKTYAAIATTTSPRKILNKFSEMSKVPVVILPLSIMGPSSSSSYRNFQMSIAKKIVEARANER